MSCDVALSAAILLTSLSPAPQAGQPGLYQVSTAMAPAASPSAPSPLLREPLYAGIVRQASTLRAEVEAYRAGLENAAVLPRFDKFKADVAALSQMDMQGHLDLAKRGTDGDLKCILKGISQDLPRKLAEVEQASAPAARDAALQDMFYLLRDNVEVITAPPAPPV